jgi:hypothetical protein
MCLNARVCALQTSGTHATSHRCIERVYPASFSLSGASALSLSNLTRAVHAHRNRSVTFPLLFRSFVDHAT